MIYPSEEAAAERAKTIIEQSIQEPHAHFAGLGLTDNFMVWRPDDKNNLVVVPAYRHGRVVGCQLINREGKRKMTKGTRGNVSHAIGSSGPKIHCIDYETGMLIKRLLGSLKRDCRVVVCFDICGMINLRGVDMSVGDAHGFDLQGHKTIFDYVKAVGQFKATAALSRYVRLSQFDAVEDWHVKTGASILALSNAVLDMEVAGADTSAVLPILAGLRGQITEYKEKRVR
jgi:hypothetical protein